MNHKTVSFDSNAEYGLTHYHDCRTPYLLHSRAPITFVKPDGIVGKRAIARQIVGLDVFCSCIL